MSKTWTPERKAMVREMLIEGLTGKQMADRLGNGITRNAVIGFVHRNPDLKAIGFKRAPNENMGTMEARAKRISIAATRSRKTIRGGIVARNRLKIVQSPPIVEVLDAAPDVSGKLGAPHVVGMDLMMLTERRCKWPINDGGPFLFCGEAKKSDGPYCAFHATVAKGKGTESERSAERVALKIAA